MGQTRSSGVVGSMSGLAINGLTQRNRSVSHLDHVVGACEQKPAARRGRASRRLSRALIVPNAGIA